VVDRYLPIDGLRWYKWLSRTDRVKNARRTVFASIYIYIRDFNATAATKTTNTYTTTAHDLAEIDTRTYICNIVGNYTGNIIMFYLQRRINNIHAREIRGDSSVKGKPCNDRCPIKLPILYYIS